MTVSLKEKYKVPFDNIDFTGKINMNGISSYMQIIAANHASILGFNYYKNGESMPEYYWIISRVKYVIDQYPLWEEEFTITTYPGGYDKLYAVRCFDLCTVEGKPIGKIIGDYLLMDVKKQRPARIKGAQGNLACLDFPYEGEKLEKLRLPETHNLEQIRCAYYSELDLNGHMNNAHYVRWIVDALPLELLKAHEISSLEINYNTSITYGVNVKVCLSQQDPLNYMIYGNSLDDETNYFIAKVALRKSKE